MIKQSKKKRWQAWRIEQILQCSVWLSVISIFVIVILYGLIQFKRPINLQQRIDIEHLSLQSKYVKTQIVAQQYLASGNTIDQWHYFLLIRMSAFEANS